MVMHADSKDGNGLAAKIWDNGMGNNFLYSEARWHIFGVIFPRSFLLVSGRNRVQPVSARYERKINPPG
jgi:hypothetical protein